MRKIIPLCLLLAACGTKPQSIPHNIYCVTPEQYKTLVDAMPPKIGNTLDPDLQKQNGQLVKQNILVRAYASGLLDVLGGCVG